MDFRGGVGSLACRLCAASYSMPIHHLHEPIDVFSEWLDDCESAANQRNGVGGGDDQAGAVPRYQDEDDEDDDDIPEAAEFNGGRGNSSKKRPAESYSISNKQQKMSSEGGTKETYTALGLDDSDDSDSDED